MAIAYLPQFSNISLSDLSKRAQWATAAIDNQSRELTHFGFQGVFTWIFAATFFHAINGVLEKELPDLRERARNYYNRPHQYDRVKKMIALIFGAIASSYLMNRPFRNSSLSAGLLGFGAYLLYKRQAQ